MWTISDQSAPMNDCDPALNDHILEAAVTINPSSGRSC
jgi:hypothetical protein